MKPPLEPTPSQDHSPGAEQPLPTFHKLGRGLSKLGRWSLRPLLVLLVFTTIVYCGFSVYATVLLNRELAELRASGAPMTYAELAPAPIDESQDAAHLYDQANAAYKTIKRSLPNERAKLRSSRGADEYYDTLAAKSGPVITLLKQAAQRPHYRAPIDWSGDPTQFIFSQHSRARDFARLMAAQSRLDARAGRMDMALEDIRVIHAMADHMKEEPTLISFLVARAISDVGDRALDEVIEIRPISLVQARSFRAKIPKVDWSQMFLRSLQGERCFSLWAYENARSNPGKFFGSSGIRQRWYLAGPLRYLWSPVFKMDEVFGLRTWKRYLAKPNLMQVPLPYNSGIGMNGLLRKTPSYAIITRMLYPAMDAARRTLDDQVTKDLQREAVLAISAYKAANGTYPMQLQQAQALWGKPLPLDHYSKQPFIYKTSGDKFLLYSVGHNRKDDGAGATYAPEQRLLAYGDDVPWQRRRR